MSFLPYPVRALLIGAEPFRRRIEQLFGGDLGFVVAGQARPPGAVLLARATGHHIMLLDADVSAQDAQDILRDIAAQQLQTRVVLITRAGNDLDDVLSALLLGARGVFAEDGTTDLLLKCVWSVLAGEYWVTRRAFATLGEALSSVVPPAGDASAITGLSNRELQVLRFVAEGCSNKEIAARLSIREDTVKHHLSRIFEKTSTSNRVELAVFALRRQLSLRAKPPGH